MSLCDVLGELATAVAIGVIVAIPFMLYSHWAWKRSRR